MNILSIIFSAMSSSSLSVLRASKTMAIFVAMASFLLLNSTVAAEETETEKPESQDMIVFLFFTFFLGAVITYILSRFAPDLPYTVVIFALGAAFTVCMTYVPQYDVLKQSAAMWDHIEPELILFMFLPALLFGEAMMLNFHHVRGAVGPAAVLAGPGALFGAIVMAAMAKWTLPYNWGWNLCLVFGTILCATDPVAVVALLKKAGASNKLTYLIIGEALMNDGTALVLYNLLYGLISKAGPHSFSAMDVLIYFIRVIFISPLLGFAFGGVSVMCLTLANRRMKEEDTTIQMAITICCAYLSFWMAERIFHVSGVLCCCAAALVLSRFAVPLFLRPETIHSIWAAFEWIGNTLIFMLAGIIIGNRAIKFLGPYDIAYILLVYVYMFVIRGIMMAVCFPALTWPRLGKVSTVRDAIFATWGGLRGAVSMALALSLVSSTEKGANIISDDDSHRVFFLVGGVAAMTLLINATSSGFVLDRLKLLDATNTLETRIMFHYVKKRIRLKAIHLLEQLQKSRPGSINPFLVAKYCSILAAPTGQSLDGMAQTADVNALHTALLPSDRSHPAIAAGQREEIATPNVRLSLNSNRAGIRFSVLDDPYSPSANLTATPDTTGGVREAPTFPSTRGLAAAAGFATINEDIADAATSQQEDAAASDAAFGVNRDERRELGHFTRDMSMMGLARDTSGLGLDRMASGYNAQSPMSPMSRPIHPTIELEEEGGGHQVPDHFARPEIMNELLTHIRRAFLEVVRVSYWRQINSGKLPRKSSAALILLNSIDVALETTDTPGLQDWDDIYDHHKELFDNLTKQDPVTAAAAHATENYPADSSAAAATGGASGATTPRRRASRANSTMSLQGVYDADKTTMIAKSLKDYREAQIVYLLTTFIDAHQYAQKRIPYYLGDTETIDTPEEALVVQESRELVNKARACLRAIDPGIITLQVSKQTARWILHMQEDQIEEFLHEGIITQRDAETLFHEVEHDFAVLGKVEWVHILMSKIRHKIRDTLLLRWCPGLASNAKSSHQSVNRDEESLDCEYVRVE